MAKLIWSEEARRDLHLTDDYTHELHSPLAAQGIIRSIFERMDILERFPLAGEQVVSPSGVATKYRRLTCGDYIGFYELDGDKAVVVRVPNDRRDWMVIFFGTDIQTE